MKLTPDRNDRNYVISFERSPFGTFDFLRIFLGKTLEGEEIRTWAWLHVTDALKI